MRKQCMTVVLGLTLLAAANLHASFAETYGFSARGIAMGNAMTAVADDWSSVFYNIAGLGRTEPAIRREAGKTSALALLRKGAEGDQGMKGAPAESPPAYNDQIGLSYFRTMPSFTIDIPRDDVKAAENLAFGTVAFGIVLDLNHFYRMPSFISSARAGLALATLSDGYMVRVNDIDLRTHNWLMYGREAQRTVIMGGVGIGFFGDKVGFGLGVNVWVGGEGYVLMKGVQVTGDPQSPEQQVKMDLRTVRAPMAGMYVSVGKIIRFLKGLVFGAAYRGEIAMDINPFMAGTQLATPTANLQLMMSIFDFYTPHIVSAGYAYTPPFHNRLTVTINGELQKWSGFRVSDARKKYWEEGGYGTDGSGNPYFLDIEIPKFRDVIIPKAGLSYRLFSWLSVMGGYCYQRSFIPDEETTGIFNMMDNDRHVASAGLRFLIPQMGGMGGPWEITVAGQYQRLVSRHSREGLLVHQSRPRCGGYRPMEGGQPGLFLRRKRRECHDRGEVPVVGTMHGGVALWKASTRNGGEYETGSF